MCRAAISSKIASPQIVSSQATHPTNGQTLAVSLCVSSASSAQLQSSGLRATTPLSLVHYVLTYANHAKSFDFNPHFDSVDSMNRLTEPSDWLSHLLSLNVSVLVVNDQNSVSIITDG